MVSKTIQTIAEQVDWRELRMAKFKFVTDEKNNTFIINRRYKTLAIRYDEGKDTYETKFYDKGELKETKTDVFWEDLKPIVSSKFKFEYVMQHFRRPPSYQQGGIVKKTGYAKVHKGELVIPRKTVDSVMKTNKGQGGYFRHRKEHAVNAKKGRRRYSVYVTPEGEKKSHYTGSSFKRRINAETYAGIESIAGMGEGYHVRKRR